MANESSRSSDPAQPPPVPCQRSGRCCQKLVSTAALNCSDEDVDRWEAEGREDILAFVSILRGPDGTIVMADFPVPPDGGHVNECPFLAWEEHRAVCGIHETKPTICAQFHCISDAFPEGGAYKLAVEQGLVDLTS